MSECARETYMSKMVNTEAHDSFPMNAKGSYSYNNNSSLQRQGLNRTKAIIEEAIAEKLDINQFSSSNNDPFSIADLGCATGPNTFVVVKNIVDAVELKFKKQPEFRVYFNDHVGNDFNTLFRTIPPNKKYFISGVPGSFYGRLFPKASLHFVHCSYSLHWLSMAPNELLDQSSPAWNKGRISYANAPNEVLDAYSNQFAKDMKTFLNSRAEEVVGGGLMALLLLCTASPLHSFAAIMDIMGSCLLDMAKLGLLSEAEIDSFNLPIYQATEKEVEELIEQNGCFSIEKVQPMFGKVVPDADITCTHMRAAMEGVFKEHFGSEIMDEFFERLVTKVKASSMLSADYVVPGELSIILKRK